MTIGAYDGVHLGHRALLAELSDRAREDGLTTAVVTFDRHPATVVRPESAPRLLCDLDQKLELLEAAGVDRTVVVRFDAERANETAEEFVNGILVAGLDARLVVVGRGFPLRTRPQGQRGLVGGDGPHRRIRGGWACRSAPNPVRTGARASRSRPPASAAWWPTGGSGRRRCCWADPIRYGVRWPTAIGGAGPSWVSRRPTSPCPPASACPERAPTPVGTSARTGRCGPQPSRWAGDPPSTAATASSWSRPTCSTSPAISTARRRGCPLWPACTMTSPSPRRRPWSTRSGGTWRTPAPCSRPGQ